MEEDHITGLVQAMKADDDAGAEAHAIALLRQAFGFLERAVVALEKIAGTSA